MADKDKQFEIQPGAPVADPQLDPVERANAEEQYAEDQKFRVENPNTPLLREFNPGVGGEF